MSENVRKVPNISYYVFKQKQSNFFFSHFSQISCDNIKWPFRAETFSFDKKALSPLVCDIISENWKFYVCFYGIFHVKNNVQNYLFF